MVMRVRVEDNGDAELEELEKRLGRLYAQAEKDARKIYQDHLEQYESELKDWEARVASGDASQAAFDRWKRTQAASLTSRESMADQLAARAARANEEAAAMVADELPRTFADSANRAAFEVDRAIGVDTGFTLYNQDAVRELVMRDPELLPRVATDYASDIAWNRQKFSSVITSGILTGASVPRVTEQLKAVFGMNDSQATRAARTAFTSAQNAGRMHTYDRARSLGINMDDVWMATLDTRTRDSHRLLDGEVKKGERFSNGCRFPGDPQGEPGEVYNCRCRLAAIVEGFKRDYSKMDDRWSDLPPRTTYEQWKAGKSYVPASTDVRTGTAGKVVDGKDILNTWHRRPDEYAFAINDVVAAQGFDGLPRVVESGEFDRLAQESSFVAQRAYSNVDKEVLQGYRDALYHGAWYIDCSTGGKAYGRGMYTASSRSGTVTRKMERSMEKYADLGERRAYDAEVLKFYRGLRDDDIIRWTNFDVTEEEAHAFRMFWLREYDDSIKLSKSELDTIDRMRESGLFSELGRVNSSMTDEIYERTTGITYIETMTLDKTARIADYDELYRSYIDGIDSLSEKGIDDIGTYAAALGYDAIEATGPQYTVILNRTKVIFRRPE